MPPKKPKVQKPSAIKTEASSANDAHKQEDAPADSETKPPLDNSSATIPSKRKAKDDSGPSKPPRRSARGAQQGPVNPVKMIQFLLSPDSLELSRPKDEIEDLKTRGPQLKTYSGSEFTPFEELMCAVVLSRPISHALGVRTIRTIFNDPYELSTPSKIREAGEEGIREAIDAARTQHKAKTAEELRLLADAVVETLGDGETDVSLERVRKECEYNVEKVGLSRSRNLESDVPANHIQEREMLKKHVKGLGKTGLDIFFRRMQCVWPKSYPFVDQRTLSSIEKLGLPNTAEDLKELLDENWNELKIEDIHGADDESKRKAFVRILERSLGVDFEGHVDIVRSKAA